MDIFYAGFNALGLLPYLTASICKEGRSKGSFYMAATTCPGWAADSLYALADVPSVGTYH